MNRPHATDPSTTGHSGPADWRRHSVLRLLDRLGLAKGKTAKLGGRVNPRLLELARDRAGVSTDSQLIELALGNLVMEDGFPEAFREARGKVGPEVDLTS